MKIARIKVTAFSDAQGFTGRDSAAAHYAFSSPFPVAIGTILLVPEWKLGQDGAIIVTNEKTGLSFLVNVRCWGAEESVALRILNDIGTPTKIFTERSVDHARG